MDILEAFGITYEQAVKLNEEAIKAEKTSYCKYSEFSVGAAILTGKGNIIHGVNVENSSYGATICAERAAVFNMVSQGEKEIKALSVCIKAEGYNLFPTPCGMCRQVMLEFGYFPIICCKSPTSFIVKTVSSIIPYSFRSLEIKPEYFAPNPKSLEGIIDAAQYYLQLDPNGPTRKEVESWVAHDDFASMKKYLTKRIDFGTAGLRGEMGPGYSRMNHLVVQQTSQVNFN